MCQGWSSSDQGAMNRSIHKQLGEPTHFPSLESVLSVSESAVDFYWDEWIEYRSQREQLINKAARLYYRAYFAETFGRMCEMFAPKVESVTYEEACKLFDHHEATGMFPDGVTEEMYNEIMNKFDLKPDREMMMDPSGGHGLYSHI